MASPNPNTKPEMVNKPTSSRLPPPSLFQGPPSRNASTLSLVPTATLQPTPTSRDGRPDLNTSASGAATASRRPRRSSVAVAQQTEMDRADAMWVEMQNTLAEVELSAENTTHIFGNEHAKVLEELRHAQLGLAQAWARSEAEDGNLDAPGKDEASVEDTKGGGSQTDELKSPSTLPNGPAAAAATGRARAHTNEISVEEETENDILIARKRREANDRYFQRVNEGVLNVVAKLEEVALAMRKVEKESRDIWSDTESIASTAETSGE